MGDGLDNLLAVGPAFGVTPSTETLESGHGEALYGSCDELQAKLLLECASAIGGLECGQKGIESRPVELGRKSYKVNGRCR